MKGLLSKFSKNFGIEKPEFRFGKDGQVYYSSFERQDCNSTISLICSQITLFEGLIKCESLFSDAEIPKNIPQNLICRDLADYAAEVVDCFSDVLGSEVCRQAAGKAFADAEEGGSGI